MEKREQIKLPMILAQLYRQAESNQGAPARIYLSGGLEIAILVDENKTTLQLGRVSMYPSNLEARVVLDAWPYPVNAKKLVEGCKMFKAAQNKGHFMKIEMPTQLSLPLTISEVKACKP